MTKTHLGLWFGAVLVASLISRWWILDSRADRCSLDGNRIEPVHRVDLMNDGRLMYSFCCLTCAREWPDVPPRAYWRVYDELTGLPLDADNACFVRSQVVTVPSRQDRFHVFKNWADALEHCTHFGGTRVTNPLVSTSLAAVEREVE